MTLNDSKIEDNIADSIAPDSADEELTAVPAKTRRKWTLLIGLPCLLLCAAAMVFLFAPFFISINGDETVTVEVFSPYEDAGAVNTITGQPIEGKGEVDTDKIGSYTVAYRWLLNTRERTVLVVDIVAPEIEVLGRELMLAVGDDYTDPGVQVSDNYDTDLAAAVVVSDGVDTSAAGEYEITYSVSDTSGNTATASRKVLVLADDFDYCQEVKAPDNCGTELIQPITDFLDLYYRSLKYLRENDFSALFAQESSAVAYMAEAAVAATVGYRSAVRNDLRLDDCSYTIEITGVEQRPDGVVQVDFTEDTSLYFRCLDGRESRQRGVENSFALKQEDGRYVIADLYRLEGVFSFFQDQTGLSTEEMDQFKYDYLQATVAAQQSYEEEQDLINDGAVCTEPSCTTAYDREKAQEYANKYALTRNPKYSDFDSNCANFVSQCINAGGIPMDGKNPYQWKYFDNRHDEVSAASGFTASWVYIPSFMEYFRGEESVVIDEDLYLYFAQPGDIIVLLRSDEADAAESPHVIIVSECVTGDDGKVLDVLCCGNTNDQLDMPLSAVAAAKKLIKIYGYNVSEN